MSDGLEAAKAEARSRARARVAALTPAARQEASERLCRWIRDWEAWRRAGVVLFYAPMRDELDIGPLAVEAFAAGKRVCLPRYVSPGVGYEVAECLADGSMTVEGRFGIREPGPAAPTVPWIQLDLALVPGVGFTPDGCRLGRGRGFMDRLLTPFQGLKCGVAFDEQVFDALPVGPYDVRLDCILTPTRRWSAGRHVAVE